MGGFVSKVTDFVGLTNYDDQEDAARDAQRAQIDATNRQIATTEAAGLRAEERLRPFEEFGKPAMDTLGRLLTPQGQNDYLQSNPMFSAAVNSAADATKAAAASSGKFGSGGLVKRLFNDYLSQGEGFLTNQFNRLLQPIQISQSSATNTAANGLGVANSLSGFFGNQGDINASGIMARQNINNAALAGGNQMLMGGLQGSGLLGGGAMGGGSALSGAGLGALLMSDARLKEDIKRVGETDDGIPIYSWKYKGDDQYHTGPMAQDVEKVKPWAVFENQDGYKMINVRAL